MGSRSPRSPGTERTATKGLGGGGPGENLECQIKATVAGTTVPAQGFHGDLDLSGRTVYVHRGDQRVDLDGHDPIVARLRDCLHRGQRYSAQVVVSGDSVQVHVHPRP